MSYAKPILETVAATEHANDDNRSCYRAHYMPRGSDATERAATTEVMTTPAFDAATYDIAVGPCRLRCTKSEHEILCKMHEEIDRRARMPVSLAQLVQVYEYSRRHADWNPTMQGKSWSDTIDAISRCIAAFQEATDATEHIECQYIATKTCDYAIALTHKTPAYSSHHHGDLLALVYQFMKNRAYNLAFTHQLNPAILCEHEGDGPFWLRITEMCMDALRNHADHLLRDMEVYRS